MIVFWINIKSRDILNEAVMAAHIDSESGLSCAQVGRPANSPVLDVVAPPLSSNNSNSHVVAIQKSSITLLNPVPAQPSVDQSESSPVIQKTTDLNGARDIVLTEVKIGDGPYSFPPPNFQS